MLPAGEIEVLAQLNSRLGLLWKGPVQRLYDNQQASYTKPPGSVLELRYNQSYPEFDASGYVTAAFHLTGGYDPNNVQLSCTLQTLASDTPAGPFINITDGRGLQLNIVDLTAYDNAIGKPFLFVALSNIQFASPTVDGVMNSSVNPTHLSSATGRFLPTDVGKTITVSGAGIAGATLTTTIVTVTSATAVVLNNAASTTVAGATVIWAPNVGQGFRLTVNGYNGGSGQGVRGQPQDFADITVTTVPQALPIAAAGTYQLNSDAGNGTTIIYFGDAVNQNQPIAVGASQTLSLASPALVWVRTASSTATLHLFGLN